MIMYINELNEYLSMLIEEYNNDYLDNYYYILLLT